MSDDSRIVQMAALADDIRTLAADMQDEGCDCPALADVRQYANWVLSAIHRTVCQLEVKA